MVETIRLFRKKEDDMWALFIIEFLKFVGCVVCDCEVHQERVLSLKVDDIYDVNLFLGVKPWEVQGKCECENNGNICGDFFVEYSIPEEFREFLRKIFKLKKAKEENEVGKFYEYANLMLREIVGKIWKDCEKEEQLLQLAELCEVYCENRLFFYLYNEGNRKYVKEQEYSYGIRQNIKAALQDTAEESYGYFKNAYNKLCRKRYGREIDGCSKNSPYFSYAELVLMYKLNQKMTNIEMGKVFKIESLLERAEYMIQQFPEFIRINYLAGCICNGTNEHYYMAEKYFFRTLKMIEEKNMEGAKAFVYYRLGELNEDVFRKEKIATNCYLKAYECNREYYPAILKLAKRSGKYRIYLCKEVIRIVLNGYEMNKVMPKQQIYAYEAFVIMGDIFKKNENYISAEKCYDNAIRLAETISEFYELFDKSKGGGYEFYEIVKRSMPVEPIIYRLIKCATNAGYLEKAEEYFQQIRE